MEKFIESIRIKGGKIHLLPYHQRRLELTQMYHYDKATTDLVKLAQSVNIPHTGIYKWRITYDKKIRSQAILPYHRTPLRSLIPVEKNTLDYNFKYENREPFREIKRHLPKGSEAIIIKNGQITDTTYSNLLFYKNSIAFTPAKPLLKGIMRQYLLDNDIIKEKKISINEHKNYQFVQLINALNPINVAPIMPIEAVLRNQLLH